MASLQRFRKKKDPRKVARRDRGYEDARPKGRVLAYVSSPRVIKASMVDKAVNALRANEVKTTTEVKGDGGPLMKTQITYPPEIISALRGMFPSGKSYRFLIHASSTLASIAGGVFNITISWSPSTTTFAEWTALAALFDEVLLTDCFLDITSAFGPTSSAIAVQIAVAPDETTASGSTPTFTAVQRLAESEFFHVAWLGHKTSPGNFHKHHRVVNRPYATTAAPTGASGIPAGCLGHWAFASNIVTTASINLLFCAVSQVVKLRCRA